MRLDLFIIAIIGTALLQAGSAQAQSTALTGQVASAAEPTMEGVLISAKKAGSAVTVTVVSDDKGRYSFPADRLEPGRYTISIRAIGYKLDGPPPPISSSARSRISSRNCRAANGSTACRESRSRRRF